MAVIKFAHFSGPFVTTSTCTASTKFHTFVIPEILKEITKDGKKDDPLAWMQYFRATLNTDHPCNVIGRLITEYYLRKPAARYFKKAPEVCEATDRLYGVGSKDHYQHVAAAMVMLAKVGLLQYDPNFIMETTVSTASGTEPLTGAQIVGLADASQFIKTEFETDMQLAVSRANATVNMGKHKEGEMPAWVGDGVPSQVKNHFNTAARSIEQHVLHYTANGSYDSAKHYQQISRMFYAYLSPDHTEWNDRYAHLNIPEEVLRVTNFWIPSMKLVTDPATNSKRHRFLTADEAKAEYTKTVFMEGVLLSALDRVKLLISKNCGSFVCGSTPVLTSVTGDQMYSRHAPFVNVETAGVVLPVFDAKAPTHATHVGLLDIDSVSGNYGHSFLVDTGITTTVSAFVREEISRLVSIYDQIKARYAIQSAVAIANCYLEDVTKEATTKVDFNYLLDLVTEGTTVNLLPTTDGLHFTGSYDRRIEMSLLSLGFVKVAEHFEFTYAEQCFQARCIDGGFPFISTDPWYGIDITDSSLNQPKKQYQDSFRTYMQAQKLFMTINPNDKDRNIDIKIPNATECKPHPVWEFARSIGVSREVLIIRETHYEQFMQQFGPAFMSIFMPANKACEVDITDIVTSTLRDFIRACNRKFGDRTRVLVEASMSDSYKADSSFEEKQSRKRAKAQSAVNAFLGVLELVAPEVETISKWLYDFSMSVAQANHNDVLTAD